MSLDDVLADMTAALSLSSSPPPATPLLPAQPQQQPHSDASDVTILQLHVEHLERQLLDAVRRREQDDRVFQQASVYASAKSTANAVLHTLFDQAKAGKHSVLTDWLDTGVIPTRDGLKHWRVDLRDIRNEDGATLLHAAVGRTMAREDSKVKLVALLLDRVGFDANVRDLFGRTPLHIAAMSNYPEVVKSLLAHGCDPTLQDRAGWTALSSVRSLSQPYEDVVKVLAAAEHATNCTLANASASVSLSHAFASALFLRHLCRFVVRARRDAFTLQTTHVLDALRVRATAFDTAIAFDTCVRDHVPMLLDGNARIASLDALVEATAFSDSAFVDALRIEADSYGLSLVAQPRATSAIAGATWIGVLLKLIQIVKRDTRLLLPSALQSEVEQDSTNASATSLQVPQAADDVDRTQQQPSVSLAVRFPGRTDRQAWHYAVLFRASTRAFPGTLTLVKESTVAIASDDVALYFPLDDRLLIGKDEYVAVTYDAQTRSLQLDRPFSGNSAVGVKAYVLGSCSTLWPPFVKAKQIFERAPGNKYEDQGSDEQELFQDYQFLHPESDYEVAVKLGPVPTARDARVIADAWKQQCRAHFDAKQCLSGLPACEHSCPQRSGQSLCGETMAVVGREIAKTRFGRATFSRSLQPRASLQKLQSDFLGATASRPPGATAWPGSPSSASVALMAAEPATPPATTTAMNTAMPLACE